MDDTRKSFEEKLEGLMRALDRYIERNEKARRRRNLLFGLSLLVVTAYLVVVAVRLLR